MQETATATKSLETPIADVGSNAAKTVPGLGSLGNGISSMMASIFKSFGSSAGSVGLFGFAEGGYVGDGGTYDPAGIVHKGEFVLRKDAVSRIGINALNALNEGRAPAFGSQAFASQSAFNSIQQNIALTHTGGRANQSYKQDIKVYAQDANSFRKTQGQLASDSMVAMRRMGSRFG
jgi:phage-related minor tail protein